MAKAQTVCLLNDSFPPLIDGVANAVMNYAERLSETGYNAMVVTPSHPEADDSKFAYPVARYPSISTQKFEGYPAGIPFSPEVAGKLREHKVVLLHTHCPIMSTFMARQLRKITDCPIVFTYHTKFDIDIDHIVKAKPLQVAAKKALVSNITACDEVWTVSRGAGENLRELGYEGEYIVMPNGVDMPLGKASAETVREATAACDLPKGVPVYLFVGRMMWYKGLRIIVDALAKQSQQGKDFRMVFVGEGESRREVQEYAERCNIAHKCIFTGAIRDRALLRGWYSRADLLLFPSTFDTNGLVVREAAACGLPAVLIRGSCAAEGVLHGRNGFLIEENADSLAACLGGLSPSAMNSVGRCAAEELYLSWDEAIKMAADRYGEVIQRHKAGLYPKRVTPTEGMLRANGELMEVLAKLPGLHHRK